MTTTLKELEDECRAEIKPPFAEAYGGEDEARQFLKGMIHASWTIEELKEVLLIMADSMEFKKIQKYKLPKR